MKDMTSRNIIVVAPHFQSFVREQAEVIQRDFANVTAMIPIPWLSEIADMIPFIGRNFRFIDWALKSQSSAVDSFMTPRFFTLPFGFARRRNHHIIAQSCINSLKPITTPYDLIHVHFLDIGYVGSVIKEKYGIPLIITGHGADVYELPMRDEWYRRLTRQTIHSADAIISVSHFNAEILKKLGLPSRKLHVIPNGFDPSRFRPLNKTNCRKFLNLPLNKKILLAVGRLSPEKGHKNLLEAFAQLCQNRHDLMLVLVGSGSLAEELEKHGRRLNLQQDLLFAGHIPNVRIPIWVNASDIVVLPSLMESYPTVIPESLGCGRPVVATRVGGVQEAIEEGTSGILVNPRSVSSLSDGLAKALESDWDYDTITSISKHLSWNQLVPRILDVYRELL